MNCTFATRGLVLSIIVKQTLEGWTQKAVSEDPNYDSGLRQTTIPLAILATTRHRHPTSQVTRERGGAERGYGVPSTYAAGDH